MTNKTVTDFVPVPRDLVRQAIAFIDSKDERAGDFISGPLERLLEATPQQAPTAAEHAVRMALEMAAIACDAAYSLDDALYRVEKINPADVLARLKEN